ncbi:deoxyribonuclease IV [Mycoplasma sp. (ex Biomphalaria glabrata)]|uniref:deoxyribonuclease IV n=1 Tax=Mycoplasma sp. (ex Biomphalaria glabrata) TaxID=1749074 RepID=UPI001E3D4288|nr:deoxyribonuclease IV [Mycoplasma sp. (ex Biomphalaria glabrata)]
MASIDKAKLSFARHFLISELERANQLGISIFVVHPGSALDNPRQNALNNAAETISIALKAVSNIKIAVETMAGKSSEIGSNFSEIKEILDKIDISVRDRVGVCLDTCHIHDAGYDLTNNFDHVINEFDKVIGLKNILVVHLNDSKNDINAKKDRHENIGKGKIGIDALMKIVYSEQLANVPKILETPYIDNKAPYKEEIDLIKSCGINKKI